MTIWLITIGEPLPVVGKDNRLLRTGIFANILVSKGWNVVWWNSKFDHISKRFWDETLIEDSPNLEIKLLEGCGYKSNVSLARIKDHNLLAKDFTEKYKVMQAPDIIVSSYPTLGLCKVAGEYGKKYSIPVLFDIRDLWPDDFLELVPPFFRPMLKFAMKPLYWKTQNVFRNAVGLVAITPSILDWGRTIANRPPRSADASIPLGYKLTKVNQQGSQSDRLGFLNREVVLRICFFGTLGRNVDLATVINVARKAEKQGLNYQFVLAGAGDFEASLHKLADGLTSVIFPGFLNREEIKEVAEKSNIGISPYIYNNSFLRSLPNKIFEYMAFKLPIVTNLNGYLWQLLKTEKCGYLYEDKSVNSLFELLRVLSGQKEELKEAGNRGFQVFKERFEADVVYDKYIRHLNRVIEEYNK